MAAFAALAPSPKAKAAPAATAGDASTPAADDEPKKDAYSDDESSDEDEARRGHVASLFLVPRDARRMYEIEVEDVRHLVRYLPMETDGRQLFKDNKDGTYEVIEKFEKKKQGLVYYTHAELLSDRDTGRKGPRTGEIVGGTVEEGWLHIPIKEGSVRVEVKPIGKDWGDKLGKFAGGGFAPLNPNFYLMPYSSEKSAIEIDTLHNKMQEWGNPLSSLPAKYTSIVASTQYKGRMYAAPCRAERVLEIDPEVGAREVGPVLGEIGVCKWFACIASDPERGRIYGIPYDARKVLEINPTMGGFAQPIGMDLGPMKGKYRCAAMAPNGDIYCAPLNAARVLRISAEGKVSLTGPNYGDLPRKYASIICAKNKLLYAPPLYADKVLEINCARGDTREIGPVIGFSEAKYACCCSAPNGKIYCAPLEARRVLEIVPEDHEVEQIGMDLGSGETEKYSDIALAPVGGKLYAAPREAHFVLEIDPDRSFVKELPPELGGVKRKFVAVVPGLTEAQKAKEVERRENVRLEKEQKAKDLEEKRARRVAKGLPPDALEDNAPVGASGRMALPSA